MLIFLKHRNVNLTELMDDLTANSLQLKQTFIAFRTLNRLLSFWWPIYQNQIKPCLQKNHLNTIADVGCGDGFLLQQIGNWAKNDGFECQLTGIEPDLRALEAVNFEHSIQFVHQYLEEIDSSFDVIISNHVIHHLTDSQFDSFLAEIAKKTTKIAVINDIRRTDLAFVLYPFVGIWFAFHTFALIDGLRSIRRSFSKNEIQNRVSNFWKIDTSYPFRLVLTYEK